MSHFLALVFVPQHIVWQGKPAIVHEVTRLMAPYNQFPNWEDYNPNGTWDGWKIGGRWEGVVRDTVRIKAPSTSAEALNPGSLEMNSCLVQELPYELVPFAVLTPDGVWHTEGEMQEFGLSHKHDPYWEDKYDQLRDHYADYLAIVLDCHI